MLAYFQNNPPANWKFPLELKYQQPYYGNKIFLSGQKEGTPTNVAVYLQIDKK